jgi:hypothetical protein
VSPYQESGPKHLDAIHDAIQGTRELPLHDWVAVAVWENDHGEVSVLGEATPLHLKGYLHSGVWEVARGPDVEAHSMQAAEDVRWFDKGHMKVVKIGGQAIGRGEFEPGWKWSESVSDIAGTETCQLSHTGFVVTGSMRIKMDDGEEFDIKAGDAVSIAPGHDAWTLGDQSCVVIEIQSAAEYARPSS